MKNKVGLFVVYGLVLLAVMFAGNQVYAAEISTPALTVGASGSIDCLATNLSSQTEEVTVSLYRATSSAADNSILDSNLTIVPNQSTGFSVVPGISSVYRCTLSGQRVNTRNWRLSACSSSSGCLSGE